MSRMLDRYRSINSLRLAFGIAVAVPMIFIFLGYQLYEEYSTQRAYRQNYGENWKAHYEERFGPDSVRKANGKMVAGFVGIPVIAGLMWTLWRQASGRSEGTSIHRRKKHRSKNKW